MKAPFFAAVICVLASSVQAAQPTWNRVWDAPCLRDFDLGGPGNAGPEIWGLACAKDSWGNSDIVHRLTPTSGWETPGGRGNWIINYNGGSTFQVYKSNGNGIGWSIVGTGIRPSCVNSLGLGGSGLQAADAWITTCTPSGNGYEVMHLGPPLAPLWSIVDSPGMARIKVDRAFDVPFAIDNNGALWNYCVPGTLGCG